MSQKRHPELELDEDTKNFMRSVEHARHELNIVPSPRKNNVKWTVIGFAAAIAMLVIAAALLLPSPFGKAEPVHLSKSDLEQVAKAQYQPFAIESASHSPIMNGEWKPSLMSLLDKALALYKEEPRRYEFALNSLKTTWTDQPTAEKTVYLTFDDGPSAMTHQVLSILNDNDVKATFFVTCQYPDSFHYIKEAYDAGHTIALHTGSHDYSKVYASDEAYFADLMQVGKMVEGQIGYVPCFVRFPGGASNTISRQYSNGIMSRLSEQLLSKGFQYYDWTASTGDGGTVNKQQAYDNAIKANWQQSVVILCHDTPSKQSTADALPDIIKFYKEQGYVFKALDRRTPITHQAIAN